jgi:hypothetical protein
MSADPFGTLIFTQTYTDPPTVTIEQADPHVLINDELLNSAHRSPGLYLLRVEPPPGLTPAPWAVWHDHDVDKDPCVYPGQCFVNWILHVDIPGRHLVYRIGKYRFESNRWEASWPD